MTGEGTRSLIEPADRDARAGPMGGCPCPDASGIPAILLGARCRR